MLAGVISDTHGTLPGWVARVFADVDIIIHAGDIGSPLVLAELECIAPVEAVAGNTDSRFDLVGVPDHRRLDIEGVRVLVVHQLEHARHLTASLPAEVLIVGHTHLPRVGKRGEMLVLNPGSASRSRGEGHSVALLRLADGVASPEIVYESQGEAESPRRS